MYCSSIIFNEKSQGSPSAADEGEADEESQQENWAGDRDANCAGVSRTFLLKLAYLAHKYFRRKKPMKDYKMNLSKIDES